MSKVTHLLVSRVGVDLSKKVVHVHAVDRPGRVVLSKAMAPQAFYAWRVHCLPSHFLVDQNADINRSNAR